MLNSRPNFCNSVTMAAGGGMVACPQIWQERKKMKEKGKYKRRKRKEKETEKKEKKS